MHYTFEYLAGVLRYLKFEWIVFNTSKKVPPIPFLKMTFLVVPRGTRNYVPTDRPNASSAKPSQPSNCLIILANSSY